MNAFGSVLKRHPRQHFMTSLLTCTILTHTALRTVHITVVGEINNAYYFDVFMFRIPLNGLIENAFVWAHQSYQLKENRVQILHGYQLH